MTGIAIFSTYAPSEGFGGPARIYHERVALEDAGHSVCHVVLRAAHARSSGRRTDFVRTVERPSGRPIDHIYHDVDLALQAIHDPGLTHEIVAHLTESGTTVIILEQPFLVDLVAEVAERIGAAVVYSSQNIEHTLRRDLERFQVDPLRSPERWQQVRDLERRAVEVADAVTTICETDRVAHHEQFGCDSIVVPNGSAIAELAAPAGRTASSAVDFAFAGSSYWPNLEGFANIATPSLAFLPPTTRIHVAGSVGGGLLSVPAIDRHHSVNASRMTIRGFLDMDDLARMMADSRAVLVPVFIGEGSNLKSADALASGAPVIMTERSTRGYEDVIAADDTGITVVDSAREFRAAMLDSLRRPAERPPVGSTRRSMLRWRHRVAPLAAVVASLTR